MNIVWFKRDLRLEDHQALSQAAKSGLILPLYIFEPELWQQPDMSDRHYSFLKDCLDDLDRSLKRLGQRLIIKVGQAVEVLEDIYQRYTINALWSHQETWNGWTYERDKQVKRWCQSKNLLWHEPSQNGVIRRLDNRDGWSARWYSQMRKQLLPSPSRLQPVGETSASLPTCLDLGLETTGFMSLQKGGRTEGLKLLESFLYERAQGYTKEMSSPVTAFESCSRLSAHLAFGSLSIREVVHACQRRSLEIQQMPQGQKGQWSSAMRSFSSRLRWHCHFIQKLEDEPHIEFENLHPAYDKLRTEEFNDAYFEAWRLGQTGYPMVDACMRALKATGWLNFRMRAMLMSFSSYHLWSHWRKPALYLASLFTDYEPGIHFSQVQMQSGTTGINAVRIYNPIKQGIDQDPDGTFIRHWVPELRDLDPGLIHKPWLSGLQKVTYPTPIVEEAMARKSASEQIYGLRKYNTEHKSTARKIVKKHGSRKSGIKKPVKKKSTQNGVQGELPL